MDVCVIGSCNTDLITYVDRMPQLGETMFGTHFVKGFGGKGANQAVMAAKLESRVLFVGCLGEDSFASDTITNFKNHGIDTSYISHCKAPSGIASITVDSRGENSIVVVSGANDHVSHERIDKAEEAISKCKVLLCQNEIPLATTLYALQKAKKLNLRTVLNTAPR